MGEELNTIICENQNLIYYIAQFFKNYPNKDDLFQVGAMGLVKAYKKYDPTMNVKLTTFAYPYILGEMKKLVREDKSMKISRDISKLSLMIEKANILLTQKWMREPTTLELATYLNIPEEYIIRSIQSTYMVRSTDEPVNTEGKEMTYADVIASPSIDIDRNLMLKEELSKLTPFERKLIEKRYFRDLTQSETAASLGESQVQVSRKEQKILTKMRSGMVA